jgi:iron complex transport system substrate-binding protein
MRKIFFIILFSLFLGAEERIVALSPAVNEIIYALGVGSEVVGNTEYCRYPKETLSVPKVGGYFSPNLEKIIALQPTVVIMQKNNYKLSKRLKQLGVDTEVVSIDTLDNIKESIIKLGDRLNQNRSAKKIVENINKSIEDTKDIIKDKKILIVIGHNSSLNRRIFVAGQNLYFDDIINESGNKNAFQTTRKGQPILNMENIIATNPDIVILIAPSMREKNLSRAELIAPWLKLPIEASKSKSIYIIDKLYAGIPSDRLVLFLEDFREILENSLQPPKASHL